MTENKRFRIEYVQGNPTIFHIVENGEHIDEIKIVDLLNELAEENEQLKDALNQRTGQCDKYYKENEQLKQEDELFFGKVFDILLKYQDLFNREMADEVLEELGIELTKWFE